MARPIYQIANEILIHWRKPHQRAIPHLKAMLAMSTAYEKCGDGTGTDVISRFLNNAEDFQGEVARRVKAELKTLIMNPK